MEEILDLTRRQVEAMEASDTGWGWGGTDGRMAFVLLRTVGRRSGREHKVALPTWLDPNGQRIVVASNGGSDRRPHWFLNILATDSNPTVLCRVQARSYWCKPEVLEGPERGSIWGLLTEDRAWYRDYQAKTSRTIELVRLPEGISPQGS